MPTYNMYMCKMVIPKPSKHVDTRTLEMMLIVGSKYNALCMVSRFTKLFGKYSVKTQIVCIHITIDNQRHYAQEMKTIVKWVNKENDKTNNGLKMPCMYRVVKISALKHSKVKKVIPTETLVKSDKCVHNYYKGPTKQCHCLYTFHM